MAFSAARASFIAESRITVTTAFSCGPSFSRRSRQVSASLTGESWRDFTRAASSRTGRYRSSESAMWSSGAEGEVGFVAVRELGRTQALAAGEIAVEVTHDARPLRLGEAVRVARAQHLGEEPRLVAAVFRRLRGFGRGGCRGRRR